MNCNESPDVKKLQNDLAEIKKSAGGIIKTLEQEVIYNQHVLKTLASVLEDGLILVDKNRKIQIFSQMASSIFGMDSKEVLGKNIKDVFPHMEHDDFSSKRKEWKLLHPEKGTPLYLDVTLSKVGLDPSVADSYILMARDITQKRTRENKVVDLATFQQFLLASIPVPMFYSDIQGGHLRGSNSFYELFKLTPQQAALKSVQDILPARVASSFVSKSEYCDTIDVLECEVYIEETHATKTVVVHKSIVKDADNKPLGWIASIVDVTGSMQKESCSKILVESLNSTNHPIAITGWPSCKILLANKSFIENYSFGGTEYLGQQISALAASLTLGLREDIVNAIDSGTEWIGEVPVLDKQGVSKVEKIRIVPIVKTGANKPSYCLFSRS